MADALLNTNASGEERKNDNQKKYGFLYLDENSTNTEYAVAYIRAGFKIIPVVWSKKKNKIVHLMDWKTEYIEDEETAKQYYAKNSKVGIAILTGAKSGVTVIDTDRHGIDGFSTRRDLEKDLGNLPMTLTVLTPNEGEHQYFKYVSNVDSNAGESAFGTGNYGMDIRNDCGLIYAPPTKKLVNAKWISYEWDAGCEEIAELPDAWKQHIRDVSNPKKSDTGTKFELSEVIESGSRNETLYKYGCSLSAKHNSPSAILKALNEANEKRCNPSLDESELLRIYDSVMNHYQSDNNDPNFKNLSDTTPPETDGGNLPAINRWDFHRLHQTTGAPIDILDNPIEKDIIIRNNIFLLNGKLYVYEDGYYKFDEDDIIIKDIVKQYIFPKLITAKRLNRVVDLLKSEKKIKIPEAQENLINNFPNHWICFKNGFLDLKTMKLHPHDPKYRNTYQIPHEWKPKHDPTGSVTERFLKDFFKDPDDLEMFLEFTGYSMTRDMSAQKLLILTGEGGLGKSVVLKSIEQTAGAENTACLTLQNLNDRFSPARLLNKLINVYADIPSEAMKDIAGLKTITGQDSVRGEYKHGATFSFHPFCKCVFSANKIPKAKDEDTSAYYRRLLIIRFTERAGYIPDLEKKLQQDIQSFITMAVMAGHRMYGRGSILESDNSKNAVLDLQMSADNVASFIHDCCVIDKKRKCKASDLYEKYVDYCLTEDEKPAPKGEFNESMQAKGYQRTNPHRNYVYKGIDLKD